MFVTSRHCEVEMIHVIAIHNKSIRCGNTQFIQILVCTLQKCDINLHLPNCILFDEIILHYGILFAFDDKICRDAVSVATLSQSN